MRSARRILLALAAIMFVFSAIPAYGDSYLGTVDFASATRGYLGGWYGNNPRSGFMSTTNDGGATWHAILTGQSSPAGLAIGGTSVARAASDTDDMVLSTQDAGGSWARNAPIVGGGASFSDIAKSSLGYVAVGQHIGTADGDVGIIYTSANGISGWTERFRGPVYPGSYDPISGDYTPGPATFARMDAVGFAPDGMTGWAIGSEWSSPLQSVAVFKRVLIYKTTNGGQTWVVQAAPTGLTAPFNDVVVTDSQHAYAIGVGRTVLLTTSGSAWTTFQSSPTPPVRPSTLYGIDSFGTSLIAAVGDSITGKAIIQSSADGGASWSYKDGPVSAKLRAISMISATKWIAVGDNETIGRTNDAGATWTWTTATPPQVLLTTPVRYDSPPATTRLVTGTSSDVGAGVASVGVSIKRDDTTYWNGSQWVATQYWNPASTSDGWDTWAWAWAPDPTEVGSHSYTVTARATDAVGQSAFSSPFVVNTYTITPSAGANGAISPGTAQTVQSGFDKTFTVTPAVGYHIFDVKKDGVSIGASESVTFTNVTANHTVEATFAVDTFTITPTAGSHGTISPAGAQTVAYGTDAAFTVTPDPGYHILDVVKDGVSLGAVSQVTFANVKADHTLSATFALDAVGTYAITPLVGQHGSITPGTVQMVTAGTDKTFTVAPDTGYHIVAVTKDGVSIGASESVTFANVSAAHTIGATFAIDTFAITPSAGAHGAISPAGVQTVDYGSDKTFTVTAESGYHVTDVLKDGVSIGASESVTFTNVTANHALSASFALNTYTLTYVPGSGGSIVGSLSQVVGHGSSGTTVTAQPSVGYDFLAWSDGNRNAARRDTGVTGDKTVTATFAAKTHTITPTAGANGVISPSTPQTVEHGSSKTFAIAAQPGYGIDEVMKDGVSIGTSSSVTFTDVTSDHALTATFKRTARPVARIAGGDRYGTAAALARKGWDPTGTNTWANVKHIIIANGEPGKESDPLAAAGLAGTYDAPVLTVQVTRLPNATKSVITDIAKKNPGVRIHLVGGTAVVPDARWNDIRKIPGVSQVKDRISGSDRYATSAAMATRIVEVKGAGAIQGVILIAGDNPAAFYDALAASPISYARTMPMLSVKKTSVPSSVSTVLKSAGIRNTPRYVASSATYIGTAAASGGTRLTTSSSRYTAATQIANYAADPGRTWTSLGDTALASQLPDALTGGAFLGRVGGVMLFTDSSSAIQTTSRSFVGSRRDAIGAGWVVGGTAVLPVAQENSYRNLLNP